MEVTGFVHLHLHTEYSMLDGAIRLNDLIPRLKEMGMTSCAITDHGVMHGTVAFYQKMKAAGLHPVIGCEVYVAPGSRLEKDPSPNKKDYHHMILLARNNEGLRNLNRLVTAGYTEGFYKKPRIDEELLARWHDGLICLSACLAGKIPSLIVEGKIDEARNTALYYDRLFGRGYFYLEIQSNMIPNQSIVNSALIRMSRDTGIPLVATNDCHYLKKEDSEVHDILLCMQTGSKLEDKGRLKMETDDFYIKSESEMRRFFSDLPEAIENTSVIASMCDAEYDFDTIHLPKYQVPEGFADNREYLSHLTYEGLDDKIAKKGMIGEKKTYLDRIEYELSVINRMGYTDYYLIVWDFINYALRNGIPVGPGRGSGAGSLVAYSLGITNIDPIRYNLVFERFLNIERVSMPDFDIDFCVDRRSEVMDYVTAKYGRDKVCQVLAFDTLAARQCIKDVAKVMGIPLPESDALAKMVPEGGKVSLQSTLQSSSEMRQKYESDPKIRKLIDYCMKLEGLPRHTTKHAAGMIISEAPITDIAPMCIKDEGVTVQYDKAGIEALGLLKFDFLGLRTLTVLKDAADEVYKNTGKVIDYDALPFDDPKIFEMIGNGDTVGVFQLESKGMTSFMKELKPTSIEDIIAGISLYRPGPMDQIPRYIKCKNDPSLVRYDHPLLEPILNVTYGCMVYQEQVIQIVRDLAGFSMGQSDLIRRAMSKKNRATMEKYREMFINGGTDENGRVVEGAVKRGVPADVASKIYDDVAAFAGYAFNKSHAASYAVVGYYTAFMKYYYPTEFMSAILNSFRTELAKASWYLSCARDMGIEILPPNVNRSGARFSTEGDKRIRIGLSMIKNVGETAVNELSKERAARGDFKSFEDFLERSSASGMNSKMVESLIYASALDWTGLTRASMISAVGTEYDKLGSITGRQLEGQMSLFELGGENCGKPSLNIPDLPEFPDSEKLEQEKDKLGMYLSGHPLDDARKFINEVCDFNMLEFKDYVDSDRIDEVDDDKNVIMYGILQKKTVRQTKSGNQMTVCEMEDHFGTFETVLFGRVNDEFSPLLVKGRGYIVTGKRSVRGSGSLSLLADRFLDIPKDPEGEGMVRLALKGRGGPVRPASAAAPSDISNVPSYPPYKKIVRRNVAIIKFDGDPKGKRFQRLLNLLAFFNGRLPVDVIFTRDGSRVRLSQQCFISDDPEVLDVIAAFTGKDNLNFE